MSLALRKMNKGLPGKGVSLGFATWALTAVTLASVGLLAFAVTPGDRSEDVYADDVEAEARGNVATVASIALEYYDPSSSTYVDSDKLRLTIDPDNFKTGVMRITTSTNSSGGMKLSMNDSDSNNALIEQGDSTSSPAKPVISSITANKTIADVTDSGKAFSDNTWGYAVADTTAGSSAAPAVPLTYSQIPIAETLLDETDELGDSAYIFTAGVRVGRTLPAGVYKDQLTFTVIANPLPEPAPGSFYEMNGKYMQASYVSTLCSAATTPSASATAPDSTGDHAGDTNYVPSITMKDQRDEQEYTIRKLADGNCWMTDNLRYGATTSGAINTDLATSSYITSANTDNPASNFSIPSTSIINTKSGFGSYFDTNAYDNPQIYIYQANLVDGGSEQIDLWSQTTDYGTATSIDGSGSHIGALYNFCAATGGTACTASGTTPTVSGSICPKGWTLPTFANAITPGSGTSDSKSYDNLLGLYNVTNDAAGYNKLIANPLNFVRAGHVTSGILYLRYASGYGFYWSASPDPSRASSAYRLRFGSSNATRGYSSRNYGFSVRCVAASS